VNVLTFSDWIQLIALVVSPVIIIGVGAWQVRVMREISARKPISTRRPSPVRKKLLATLRWVMFIAFGFVNPVYFIYSTLASYEAISRGMILMVSLNLCLIFFSISNLFFIFILSQIIHVFESQHLVNIEMVKELEQHKSSLKYVVENLSATTRKSKQ
jgi:magnesium-transporting ATPase (P-type)